jgi:bifunctional N-acetylglucosamine-1-phosphate-uridyltransferase/glucosamine-1-phosphate-acetyltransferase GlmU-like protein
VSSSHEASESYLTSAVSAEEARRPTLSDVFYMLLETVLRQLKGRRYNLDRRIPFHLVCMILLRRSAWLVRGILKTTVFAWKPALIFIGPGVRLRNLSSCSFGKGVTLEAGVLLDGLSYQGVRLGDNVTIGSYSEIRSSMFTSLGAGVQFGRNSGCGPYSFIGAGGPVIIGENVIMGQHVAFHAENHNFDRLDVPIREQGVTKLGITIEDDCWVGANVTFLDGSYVGRGCVIAAGAVVRGVIPAFSVAAGVPATVKKSRKRESSREA